MADNRQDPPPPGPPERPTTKLAQSEIQTQLLNKLIAGVDALSGNVDALTGKVDAMNHGLGTVTDKVNDLDTRLKVVEDRDPSIQQVDIPRYSGRVSALEQNDTSFSKRLEVLEQKTDAQTVTLDKILGNPDVKKLLGALAGLALALIALGTAATWQRVGAIQLKTDEKPVSPTVTVVPVFVPVADAGGGLDAHL